MHERFTTLAHESTHSFGGFLDSISAASTTILRTDANGRSIAEIDDRAKLWCHLCGRGEQIIVWD